MAYLDYQSLRSSQSLPPEPDWEQLIAQLAARGYQVKTTLGEGGFGRAYKCIDDSGAEKVIKVSTAGVALHEEYVHMLETQ